MMDRAQRFRILAEAAADDRETGLPARARLNEGPVGIRPVRLPGGGSTTLMRVMQTNACALSCGYCPTFCGGRVKRTALSPEEVARTFLESHRGGVAQGLFLTSGVPGRASRAVDRMLAAVEILRRREGFAGYVHIKMLPGAERDQVIAATRLATRVSVNLEGPNDAVVRDLALEHDPKTAWALAHVERFPVALERAPYELLLRVPGIGPTAARRLVAERRRTLPRGAQDLRRLGVDATRAGYFLTLRGRRVRPTLPAEQLRLFPPRGHLTQGPWRTAVPPCAYR